MRAGVPLLLDAQNIVRKLVSNRVSQFAVIFGIRSNSCYYLIAELSYASQEVFGAAMESPEGQAAGADVPNFATGGVTMFVAYD